MTVELLDWVKLLAVSAFGFGGAWMGVQTKLNFLRRDVDLAHTRLDRHDGQLLELYKRQ